MRIAAIGDCLVDIYPDMGMMYPGGNALNVAVAARRAGAEAGFVGAVGDDDPGKVVLAALRGEQVGYERLRVVPNGPTSHATVAIVAGERTFTGGDIGVSAVDLTDEDERYLAGFDLIHTGDNSLIEHYVPRLAALAPISFDFGSRSNDYCTRLMSCVTVGVFSIDPGKPVDEVLRYAVRGGCRVALGTGGRAGSWVLIDDTIHHAPAATTTDIVDTLGAGDAFIGAFLVGYLRQDVPATMLRQAAFAAAEAVSVHGAFGYGRSATAVGSTGKRVQ